MLTVLSWNILAHEWITSLYHKMIQPHLLDRKTRLRVILKNLLNYDSDIVLLQEVMINEYNAIKRLIGHIYHISPLNPIIWQYQPSLNKSVPESGNVTLLKKSIFSSKNIKHHKMSFGIRTRCIYNRANLSIFNIHLDDLSTVKRYNQLSSLTDSFTKYTIIAGDFNQVYKKESKLYNVEGFKIYNVNCPTYYIERKMNIDNILYSGLAVVKRSCCEYYPRTLEEKFRIYASDHLPIRAEFV